MSYAWLTSARDAFAVELLDAVRKAPTSAELKVAASEKGPVYEDVRRRAEEMCGRFIPLPANRAERDRVILEELTRADGIDFLFLGGYMKKLPSSVTGTVPCLNLHPALPDGPVGTWQEVTWQLIEAEAPETGCKIHVATDEVDRGPVVSYCRIPIRGPQFDALWSAFSAKAQLQGGLASVKAAEGESEPLFRAIRERQFAFEKPLVTLTLGLLTRPDVTLSQSGLSLDLTDGIRLEER